MAAPRKPAARRSSAVPVPSDDRERLSIESIKNGFLITREGTRKGKWFSEREFSSVKPVITADTPASKGKR